MNRRIIGIFITSVLSALPALGAKILDNLPESPTSRFCNGGGELHCSKVTINGDETTKYSGMLGCTNGLKSGISQQELDAAATEYCNLLYNNNSKSSFNFAAASRATQNEIPAWQLPPATNDAVVSTVTEAEKVATVESTVTDTCGPDDKCSKTATFDFLKTNQNKISGAVCINNVLHVTGCVEPYKPQNRATCIRNGETVVYYTGCELKVGDNCTSENAKTAKYVKVGNDVVCHAKSCKCGYKLSNHKCIELQRDEKKCTALNASAAYYECQGDKKVCKIETCKDTHFLDSTQNKCVSKKSVKCQDSQTVNDTGKCIDQTTIQPTDTDTCGDEDACKQDKQQFLNQHPNAEAAICVQGNWQIAICKNGTQPDTYKHRCTRQNIPLVYYTKCIEPNFETSKKLCEKDGNGKWQEKQNKCDCRNNYFWDENDGCVASTENLNQATKKLEQLKSLLDEKLKTLNNEQ